VGYLLCSALNTPCAVKSLKDHCDCSFNIYSAEFAFSRMGAEG